jgi:DmsE family decaheme c-type cytochrome
VKRGHWRQLIWIALMAPLLAAAGADEYLPNDPQSCLMCHGGQQHGSDILSSRHAVAAGEQGCQRCHGPSAGHMAVGPDGVRPPPPVSFRKGGEPAESRDAVCLGCHQAEAGMHWQGGAHQSAEVACTDCHRIHTASDPTMSPAGATGLCLNCHRELRAELLRPSTHPLREGQMSCTDCHAPHGSSAPAELVRDDLNTTCYDCHAEKRGPFLWEHAPVAEDCSHCHLAHGSNHRGLLQARTPWLCQQCHLAQFHPSNAESGMGLPSRGGASGQLMGRDCMNCHSQVHGSNHPSGAGLTR